MQLKDTQQVAGNPCQRSRFTTESHDKRLLEIQHEQRALQGSACHIFLVYLFTYLFIDLFIIQTLTKVREFHQPQDKISCLLLLVYW